MCSPAVCPNCKNITYTGCGAHAAQVLALFPKEQHCTCKR